MNKVMAFGALWLVSLLALLNLVSEFRATDSVQILGATYHGTDSLLALGLISIVPVTLLALAIREAYEHFKRRR